MSCVFLIVLFAQLEWRLDVEVASRSLRGQVNPSYLLQIDTRQNGAAEQHLVTADYQNLQRIVASLEEALVQSTTAHARRVVRSIR